MWKRVTDNFDEAVKKFAANPEMASVVTRLVFFKHLTVKQGMAARRYATIMRDHDRYFVDGARRSAKAQNPEPVRAGEDQEIQRHVLNGTISDYEVSANKCKRAYRRMMRVLDRFGDASTGRNAAKNILDDLCLSDVEPPAQYRSNIAAVLEAIAGEFAVKDAKEGRR